jgi:hypothetical protein
VAERHPGSHQQGARQHELIPQPARRFQRAVEQRRGSIHVTVQRHRDVGEEPGRVGAHPIAGLAAHRERPVQRRLSLIELPEPVPGLAQHAQGSVPRDRPSPRRGPPVTGRVRRGRRPTGNSIRRRAMSPAWASASTARSAIARSRGFQVQRRPGRLLQVERDRAWGSAPAARPPPACSRPAGAAAAAHAWRASRRRRRAGCPSRTATAPGRSSSGTSSSSSSASASSSLRGSTISDSSSRSNRPRGKTDARRTSSRARRD